MRNGLATQFAKREGCFAEAIAKSWSKCLKKKGADVAELVDARDLKSLGLARTGSIPVVRTMILVNQAAPLPAPA